MRVGGDVTVVEPKEPKEPKRPTVSCVFVCHDGAGRVLLARRSAGARDEPGAWDCGAGALEFGESFERAVAREVYEEYGVRPLGIEQIGVRNVLRGDPVDSHWVAVVFAVRVERDEVTIGEPHKFDALDWFAPHALPVPLHSQCGATLELFEAGGGARERWPGRRQG
ncbi:ADP-ribose pyrophosphatase YjhB (NUDIX family) [Streptomyces sp. 2333.5]|nr:ADP-ribose pyrophosphatase YjhB (NUDIX family) [Streptomyces sp. 2333.5]SED14632.1 ADP-ribose pyrophosphatase YjhB, NUDIX family [Streptomyces sp. 2112.2]